MRCAMLFSPSAYSRTLLPILPSRKTKLDFVLDLNDMCVNRFVAVGASMVRHPSDSTELLCRCVSAKELRALGRPCAEFFPFPALFQVQSTEKNVSRKKWAARGMPESPTSTLGTAHTLRRRTPYPTKNECSEIAEITCKIGKKFLESVFNGLRGLGCLEGVDRGGAGLAGLAELAGLVGRDGVGGLPG